MWKCPVNLPQGEGGGFKLHELPNRSDIGNSWTCVLAIVLSQCYGISSVLHYTSSQVIIMLILLTNIWTLLLSFVPPPFKCKLAAMWVTVFISRSWNSAPRTPSLPLWIGCIWLERLMWWRWNTKHCVFTTTWLLGPFLGEECRGRTHRKCDTYTIVSIWHCYSLTVTEVSVVQTR